MILTWARGHTCFREEGSHFLHTSFRGIIIIIIRLFLPLITSSEKLADVKPELPMGLQTSHSSRYPKWFRSSLISLWIICLLQKKGGEQMCKTERRRDYDNHISPSQKGGVSVCTGVEREKERLYAEELQKFKTQVRLDMITVCKSFLVRIFPFGWFNKCNLDQVSIMQEIC